MYHRKATTVTTTTRTTTPTIDAVGGGGHYGDTGCCAHPHHHGHHHPTTTSSSSTTEKRKRRRRRRPNQSISFWAIWQSLLQQDSILLLIQLLSIGILIGCGLTLILQSIWGSATVQVLSSWMSFFGGGGGGGPILRRHGSKIYPKIPLKPSRFYTIPNSMSHIGDKSDEYALLRKEIDARQVDLPPIQHQYQFGPHPMDVSNSDQVPSSYDIYNCPETPPQGYPYAWKVLQILEAWPADDPTPRSRVYQGLCVFDYTKDLEKAMVYRNAELPFVIQNDPQVVQAAQRWNTPGYMDRLMGNVKHRAEYSKNNHFLYWNMPPSERKNRQKMQQKQKKNKNQKLHAWQRQIEAPQDWTEPTKMLRMTYQDWYSHANITDDSLLGPDQPHWYFRLIGCGETGPQGECDAGSSEYLFDELPFFQPKPSLYIVQPEEQKGIHCRFGMKGVIAENHFDGSRNMIVVLGGQRRYILSHPDQCDFLSLLPKGHPSARHSAVDWSDPDLDQFPEFRMAQANEVVLQAGDVLYLPTNWFHFIVSLTLNFQCNTRSGISQDYMAPIHACGF